MDTLFNKYQTTLSTTKWQYYDFSANTSIFNNDQCKVFITNYLRKGEKAGMFITNYLNEIPIERAKHILSCFLLGIIIYNEHSHIHDSIDDFLIKNTRDRWESLEERFKYIWMLASIFHDFGYAVEEKKATTDSEISTLIKQMPSKSKGVPRLYNKKILERYDEYKNCRFYCHDHGVVGGLQLYHDLYKLREEKSQSDSKLYWGPDLMKDVSLAAWAIACHNIFYIEESSKYVRCYERFGIEKLVYQGKTRKINIKRHPIFFLLCLVDSIEPLKICKDINILNEVRIDILSNKIVIELSSISCQDNKLNYGEKISSLNDWLIDVEELDDVVIIKN